MKFKWQQINFTKDPKATDGGVTTLRAKVFGGWLVVTNVESINRTGLTDSSLAMSFIPDKDHKWKIDK